MANTADRVRAGIALLDEHGPKDWRARVNVNTLSFPNTEDCPLGQIYGSFGIGLLQMKEKGVTFGPSGSFEAGFMASSDRGYAALTQEWRRQLGGES